MSQKIANIFILLCFISSFAFAQDKPLIAKRIESISSNMNEFYSLIIDSATFYFTSDRKSLKGEKISAFSQNIYVSSKENGDWSHSKKLPYFLNSDNHDACAGLSTDRKTLLIYKRFNGGDIYFTGKNEKGNWKELKPVEINSEFHESSATMNDSAIYFTSDKQNGLGSHDVYFAKIDENGKIGKAQLIPELNSEFDENYVFLTEDGNTLYFSSNREDSIYNIYQSNKIYEGKWSEPQKLAFPINSDKNDICYTEDLDGNIYLSSDRIDSLQYEIFKIEVEKEITPIAEKEKIISIPIRLIGESKIELNHIGEIIQIKDSVKVECLPGNAPAYFELNKAFVADTSKLLHVSDIITDESFKILDNPDDAIIKIKKNEGLSLDEVKSEIDFDIKYCRVQVGAFVNITSVKDFESKYPKLKGKVELETHPSLNKFLMKEICKDLDEASVLQKKCLTDYESVSDTFIGVYSEEGERIVIFFDVEKNKYILLRK